MFLSGAKDLKLDPKVRLTLPADFRKEFDTQVRVIPMNDALYGFTPEGYESWMRGIFTPEFKAEHPNHMSLWRAMTGRTVMLDIDSAGRIALGKVDAKYREKLGVERDVVVAGAGERFEIWNADAWHAMNDAVTDEEFAELEDSLNF